METKKETPVMKVLNEVEIVCKLRYLCSLLSRVVPRVAFLHKLAALSKGSAQY